MLFSSSEFIFVFLPAAVLFIYAARYLGYNAFLLAISVASLLFYSYTIPIYALLLVASAVANYTLSLFIAYGRRGWLYGLGIAANLALLAYYKYANFFLENLSAVTGIETPALSIALPLAISFITFEQIAFLSDVRSGRVSRGTPLEYLTFITLFPKLIAGPIIRYTEILPQIEQRSDRSAERLLTGICIFSFGLFCKVVIADSLAPIFDAVHEVSREGLVSASDAAIGVLAYAARIYFDFSAYSTMAIGIAWMFGIRLPINFLSPYKATSVVDFWHRWHITLSRFLRDYLYIPLGGNRLGLGRRYVNLMIVMLLGGLWHGAAWTFVIWGGIHGTALAINHMWREWAPQALRRIFATRIVSWAFTMLVVLAAWVFFASADTATALNLFASLGSGGELSIIDASQILVVAAAWCVALLAPNAATIFRFRFLIEKSDWRNLPPIPLPGYFLVWVSALALAIAVIFTLSGAPNEFIYFQF